MINTTELVRELPYQIRLGEDSAYEFKAITVQDQRIERPQCDSVADELAAFANASGGILVLGIHDKTRETVENMDANSVTRNETLVNLLSRYFPADPVSGRQNMIERRGEGVPIILNASERLSTRRPLYEQIDTVELKLTIYAASRKKTVCWRNSVKLALTMPFLNSERTSY